MRIRITTAVLLLVLGSCAQTSQVTGEDPNAGLIQISWIRSASDGTDERETLLFVKTGQAIRISSIRSDLGPRLHSTWTISPEGYARVRAEIAELELDQGGTEGDFRSAGSILIEDEERVTLFRGLDETGSASDQGNQQRENFRLLWDRLNDLDWYGSELKESERPWIPETIALEVGQFPPPEASVAVDWPFEQPVIAMTPSVIVELEDDRSETFSVGSRLICLSGPDAAVAWQTIISDDGPHTRINVSDGTRYAAWTMINYPGGADILADRACPDS